MSWEQFGKVVRNCGLEPYNLSSCSPEMWKCLAGASLRALASNNCANTDVAKRRKICKSLT